MIAILRDNWGFLLAGGFPAEPLGGMALNLIMAVLSFALVFPLAAGVALLRTRGRGTLFAAATAYVYFARGVPLLMVVFWIYFFLPYLVGVPISGFLTIIIALTFYQTAFLSEVFRGGIAALPAGQFEAARSLGLRPAATWRRVILPQVFRNTLPGTLNQVVNMLKETSLGYVIGVGEVTYVTGQINGELLTRPLQVFACLAVLYFLLCFTISQAAQALARRHAAPSR